MAHKVSSYQPSRGWPGTLITIVGEGFSENRDENEVWIGGERALIVNAAEHELLVLAGENTKSDLLTVVVAGTGVDAGDFKVLDYPDPTLPAVAGAPRFFHGPQHGTPATNVQNQKVLVLFAYTTAASPTAALRSQEINNIELARRYWKEASYGSTSWDMRYENWVKLPRDHGGYFWTSADVEGARRRLLAGSSRPISRSGTWIANGANTGWIPVQELSPGGWSFHLGPSGVDGTAPRALKHVGNLLYAATSGGTLIIYDVTDHAAATVLGSLNLGPPFSLWDVDVTGTTAVVAMGEFGVATIDVSNSSAPAPMLVPAPTSTPVREWRTVCRAVDNRVYANAGTEFRVYELPSLNVITKVNLGFWITDIAVEGGTIVVATDQGGLFVFEATPGGAVQRGKFLGASRIRSIKLSNGVAYLAANAQGLVIVDCHDLQAPAKLGEKVTTLPVYNLAVSGTEIILAAGNSILVHVDASDPANPKIIGSQTPSGFEPPLADWQAALQVAADGFPKAKSRDRLVIDSLNAHFVATGTGPDELNDFKGVLLVVEGDSARGESWIAQEFVDGPDRVRLNDAKGAFFLHIGANMGDYAHEIIHWLGIGDIYSEWYSDGTVLAGTAQEWCLSGNSGPAPLCSAQRLHEHLHWYQTGNPADTNVLELTWSPTSVVDDVFEVVAHGATQDSTPNRYHALKLVAASGLIYYIEVRQNKPPGLLWDQSLPLPAGDPGRVVVMRSTEGATFSNVFERPIQLVDMLAVDGQMVDAARNLVVKVEEQSQTDPLAFRVRVQWNAPVPGDPNGKFDLTITPWDTKTWESPDIWVDSERNNSGATRIYEFHAPGNPEAPILNGDRPWVKHPNKIFARIRNTGPETVPEAWVSCYITSPPGIGDNGSWQLIGTKKVENVPGQGELLVDFDWAPAVAGHTCISVAILPRVGEIATDNNRAQENVATFDSTAASSHQPVILEAEVRSPFTIWKKVDLLVQGLPEGWHAVVDKAWVWLPGKGAAPSRTVIYNDIQTPWGEHRNYPRLALPRVEGWTDYLDRYEPIGGILAPVRAVKKVNKIDLGLEAGGGTIYVWGKLIPSVANVGIAIEVTDEHGHRFIVHAQTDHNGAFSAQAGDPGRPLAPGPYGVQAFVVPGGDAGETESKIVTTIVG